MKYTFFILLILCAISSVYPIDMSNMNSCRPAVIHIAKNKLPGNAISLPTMTI